MAESGSAAVSIVFVFTSLCVGVLISQILNYFNNAIPFTVVIFLFGILMAFFDYQYFGLWSESVSDWTDFNSELIFYFLLPPLILGEAMYLNWYYAVGGMSQSILLAGPGVIIGTILMGTLTKYVLPYDWSWNFSLLFGAILSATDPVAVVSLLKGCDASPKLTILIIGESILNDGTAMVMFTLLFNMLNGQTYTVADIALYLTNSCLGSMSFGIGCGLGMVYWMRTLTNKYKELDSILQITITVTCGYLIFFVAQNSLSQSGVLALCGTGIVLAALAPPIILNQEAMHNVWETVCWFMNTILFLVVGLRLGNQLMKTATAIDYFLVVALYLLLMLCRIIMIALFYPILSRTGHKCTIREAIFISWSGLRGGVAMVLALLVGTNSNTEISSDENNRFFFFVGGVTALTLLINGTLAETVLLRLGLIGDQSIEKLAIANHVRRQVYKQIDECCEKLENKNSKHYVRSRCSVLKIRHTGRSPSRPVSGQPPTLMRAGDSLRSGDATPRSILQSDDEDSNGNDNGHNEKKESLEIVIEAEEEDDEDHDKDDNNDDDDNDDDNDITNNNLEQPLLTKSNSNRSKSSSSAKSTTNEAPARTKSSTIIPFFGDAQTRENIMKSEQMSKTLTAGQRNSHKPKTTVSILSSADADSPFVSGLTRFSSDSSSLVLDVNDMNSDMNRDQSQFQQLGNGDGEPASDSTDSFEQYPSPFDKRNKSVASLLTGVHTSRLSVRGDRQSLLSRVSEAGVIKLSYYRTIFLSIVRAKYRTDIQEGTLPRYSHCALFLLYSIDVGLDLVHSALPGLQDWTTLEQELDKEQPLTWALYCVGRWFNSHIVLNFLLRLEARKIKRAVYLLTSFIAAHEYAQTKLHEYSSISDDFDIHPASSQQEQKVLAESKIAVCMCYKYIYTCYPLP